MMRNYLRRRFLNLRQVPEAFLIMLKIWNLQRICQHYLIFGYDSFFSSKGKNIDWKWYWRKDILFFCVYRRRCSWKLYKSLRIQKHVCSASKNNDFSRSLFVIKSSFLFSFSRCCEHTRNKVEMKASNLWLKFLTKTRHLKELFNSFPRSFIFIP